jgi:hypothetical protein
MNDPPGVDDILGAIGDIGSGAVGLVTSIPGPWDW